MTSEQRILESLRVIVDYQFGPGAGSALFPPAAPPEIRRSTSGRPKQLLGETGRLVTFGQDGRCTLGYAGGVRLHEALDPPAYRVAVGDESEPFVVDGENAFAKFVRSVDPAIRPFDEVLVIHDTSGELLGVGRAELSAAAMRDFETGVAVSIREGRAEWDERR